MVNGKQRFKLVRILVVDNDFMIKRFLKEVLRIKYDICSEAKNFDLFHYSIFQF